MSIETLKTAVGIATANCDTCAYCILPEDFRDTDTPYCTQGPEFGKAESFPFAAEQPCWRPLFRLSSFAQQVKPNSIPRFSDAYDAFDACVREHRASVAVPA